MSEPIVWENIPKSQADPQTIDEAIAAAVVTHNADTEAHLGELESLQTHRTNEILDALADSVKNDKLQPSARSFVAIVDPAAEWDFDTIAGAVAYANLNGGGRILVRTGEHYISEDITAVSNVVLVGEDNLGTQIYMGDSTLGKLTFDDDNTYCRSRFGIENLTVIGDGGVCFTYTGGVSEALGGFYAIDCNFEGGGAYFLSGGVTGYFTGCVIACDSVGAVQSNSRTLFNGCIVSCLENGAKFLTRSGGGSGAIAAHLIDTELSDDGTGTTIYWYGTLTSSNVIGCSMYNPLTSGNSMANCKILNSFFYFSATGQLVLSGAENRLNGCTLQKEEGTNDALNTSGAMNIVTENVIAIGITQSGTDRIVANNITYAI